MLDHLLTGATTMSLAAHSPVPVHSVPRSWSEQRSASGRLVVGLDGSPADQAILEEAFAEAAARQASLELVHAWRPVSPYDAAIGGRVLRDGWEAAARDALARRAVAVAAHHRGVAWDLRLEYERVPVALHEAAMHADLLVIGRHSHSAVLHVLVGSNTRTLLHRAPCPVVVVPVPLAALPGQVTSTA
jgi:nucleotide-binding universal stress UspA family protein